MQTIISTNPSRNYEIIGSVQITPNEVIENMVTNARKVQVYWENLGLQKRISLLRNLISKFEREKEKLSQMTCAEMGMPITQARGDMENGLNYFNWYLEHAEKYLSPEVTYDLENERHEIYFMPVGVVASIIS